MQVLDTRAAPPVDGLVVVADDERNGFGAVGRGIARQQRQPGVLNGVGVLEFVHQHVAEAPAIVGQQRWVVAPELVGPQQQLGKVDGAVTGAGLLIVHVQLDELAASGIVVVLEVARPAPLFLVRIDEPLHLARRPARLIQIARLDQLLDHALLVFGIEDLKALHEPGVAPVEAQQPMRQAVERADPERAARYPQQRLDPPAHLTRSLVRERHGQHAMRGHVLSLDQPGDPVREYACLAAPGSGEHQDRTERGGDRLALRFVQGIEKEGQVHGGRIVP